MKQKAIIILTAVIIISGNLFAQNDGAGNTGLSFLKLGISARATGMGEAYSSVVEDASAFMYNPARLNATNNANLVGMYNKSMVDLYSGFIGAKFRAGKFGIGIGLIKTSVEDIEIRNIPGEPIDRFNAHNFAGGISASYQLHENFTIGTTLKLIYEKIYVDEASGFGLDIGTNYSKDNYSLSFVISNIGSMNELKYESTKLPTSLRFGGAYTYKKDNFSFTGAADGFKVLDGGSFHGHFGGEAGYKDMIFLRAGYQLNYENKGFSAGLGLKYKNFYLDYAFIPFSSEFGTGNTFSLGINF